MTALTCTTAAAALAQSELTPLDLVERCLKRIERFEPTIQAWVMIDAGSHGAKQHCWVKS